MNSKALAATALLLIIVGPLCIGYLTSVGEEEVEGWTSVESKNISELMINHNTPYTASYHGTTNNSTLYRDSNHGNPLSPSYVTLSEAYSVYPVVTSTEVTLTPNGRTIIMPLNYSWSLSVAEISYELNGTYHGLGWNSSGYHWEYDAETRTLNGGSTVIETLEVYQSTPLTIYRLTEEDLYGQPVDGWTLPASSVYWSNKQNNSSETFIINVPSGASLTLGYGVKAQITNTDGTVTVSNASSTSGTVPAPVSLGPYQYMQVIIMRDHITINAIGAWPPMNGSPQIYNTAEVSMPEAGIIPVPSNNVLWLSSATAVKPILRCDSTEIVAGTFPSTLDYTLDLGALFPGKALNLKLNSIGVYGDSLSIAGAEYPVNNGRISVDGKLIPLRGSVWEFLPDDGQYQVSVNGRSLGTFGAVPPITFGGEWSLTSTAYFMENTTHTQTVWHAGEFSLDASGFAAAGLIFAGIAFLVLGMNGRRSGAKVGLLLLICGGAAAVYIMLI